MGINPSTNLNFESDPELALLSKEQLERASCLLNIHCALRILFENPENIRGFMDMTNHSAYFGGRKPVEIIKLGTLSDLREVFCHIDALKDIRSN